MNGISALIKRTSDLKDRETSESPLDSSAMSGCTHTIYESGSGPSPDTESAATLTLDFPASRIASNTFLLFINPVDGNLLKRPEWRKTLLCSALFRTPVSHRHLFSEGPRRFLPFSLSFFSPSL